MANRFGCVRVELALVLLAAAGCGNARLSGDALAARAPTVLRLEALSIDPDGVLRRRALGTGFLVSDAGDVVTARHVSENGRTLGETFGNVQVVTRLPFPAPATAGSRRAVSARATLSFVADDPDNDLALLRLGTTTSVAAEPEDRAAPPSVELRVARLSMQAPRIGDVVVLSGYPTPAEDRVQSVGRIIELPDIELEPLPVKRAPSPLERTRAESLFFAALETRIGHSGSPVFLPETGEVIGVCLAILFDSLDGQQVPRRELLEPATRRVTAVLRSREIIAFLETHHVRWKPVPRVPAVSAGG